jgi:CheY-like chemotaxis protein
MNILDIFAASDFKVELVQPTSNTPAYIEILKLILSWPTIILITFVWILLRFERSIKKFLENLGEVSLKAGGVEASAKRHQIEAAASLGAASAFHQMSVTDEHALPAEVSLDAVAQVLSDAIEPTTARRLASASVLWVDDRPENNVYERKSLEALGVHFEMSTSTEDALKKIRQNDFDLVISDMGRPPDDKAGYTLLDRLRSLGNKIPFIIYAGSRAQEHRDEAIRHGAMGCTNSPQELFELVITAISKKRSTPTTR